MLYETTESREVFGDVIFNEIVRLTAANPYGKYSQTFRLVRSIVTVDGEKRKMTFLEQHEVGQHEVGGEHDLRALQGEIGDRGFFKELKQTLQLTDSIGTNENAGKWQIWTGLLIRLLMHYLEFISGWNKAFPRLAGIVRSAEWINLDIEEKTCASMGWYRHRIAFSRIWRAFEPQTANLVGWNLY